MAKSLKNKAEDAFITVMQNAGYYSGNYYRSQENNATTRTLPATVAICTPLRPWPLDKNGQTIGMQRLRVDVLIMGTADQSETDSTPDVTHSDNVQAIRNSLWVTNLATLLTDAESDFCCLGTIAQAPASYEQENRIFQDVFSWEIVAGDFDG